MWGFWSTPRPIKEKCAKLLISGPYGEFSCTGVNKLCPTCGLCFLGNDGTWTCQGFHCICEEEVRMQQAFEWGIL